jgi:hypothetical protein
MKCIMCEDTHWRTCVIAVPVVPVVVVNVVKLQTPWRSMKLIGTAPDAARYSTARVFDDIDLYEKPKD